MLHVLARKGRNEKVRVVIAILIPHLDTLTRLLRRLLKVLRQELALLVEVVARAHIDQDIRIIRILPNEFRRIMLRPLLFLVFSKVA